MHSDGFTRERNGMRAGRTLRLRIPPNARLSRHVRKEVISFAHGFEVSRRDLDELVYAIGEALANAIEHSRSTDAIEVRCRVEDDKILATIVDSGSGFEAELTQKVMLPSEWSERGRGLPLMRSLSDIFAVHSVPGKGTAVVLGRYLKRHARGQENQRAS